MAWWLAASEMPTNNLLPRRHRNDPVLADQLFADGVPRKAFPVQAVQVAGDAELLGGQFGQGQAAYQLVLHQVRHQRQLVALRLRLGLQGGLFVE